jgi:hypothetical protein
VVVVVVVVVVLVVVVVKIPRIPAWDGKWQPRGCISPFAAASEVTLTTNNTNPQYSLLSEE